jgi:GT2 family glycosyltransferase
MFRITSIKNLFKIKDLLTLKNVIGIVVLNWNGLADTLECLASLQKSSYGFYRAYVVDNASATNEAEIIAVKFPEICLLKQNENLGFCAGNNIGIRKALAEGAEYIMLLNNDTMVAEDSIEKLLNDFKSSGAGAISPVILEHPDTEKVWFAKAEWNSKRAQFSLNPEGASYETLKERSVWESEFACGCCLLTSAQVLENVGLLDERYFAYYDEAEWCKRLERHGYKSYVTPATVIYHKVSRTTPGIVATYLLTRNRLLWMKENLSFKMRCKSFPYLTKELAWHILNTWGWVRGQYSKKHSRALIRGWKDHMLKKYGRWNKKVEKLLFSTSASKEN